MSAQILDNLLAVTNDREIGETGGGHNTKGIEFQKHWAILRMFNLYETGVEFLVLFESVQDIAILDSQFTPKSICVYQVKKKDRNEWSWNNLTALTAPEDNTKKKTKKVKDSEEPKKKAGKIDSEIEASIKIAGSPIGKLYKACCTIKDLDVTGTFISNAGVNIPLAGGGNVATTISPNLSLVDTEYRALLNKAFGISDTSTDHLSLSKIFIEKVNIPIDDPSTYLVGIINKYLSKASPTHAGQAQSLLNALMAEIGPLGAKTQKCLSFEEVVKQRGYSKEQFSRALSDLETIPDVKFFWDKLLDQLHTEGLNFLDGMKLQIEFAAYYKKLVAGVKSREEEQLEQTIDSFLITVGFNGPFIRLFDKAYHHLLVTFPEIRKEHCIVVLAIRAIKNAWT